MLTVPTIDDIVQATLANRAPRLADQATASNIMLSHMLYADDRKYSHWELFVMRMKQHRDRVRDAWLVLTGRADIGDW